ncbi:MAG: hypothetical protein IH986_12510 [Planctomycetes bacterium]|nr:hypothetical protein [Planctomycetota bacterium]
MPATCSAAGIDALREIDASFRKSGEGFILLTVCEILDEEIARKLPRHANQRVR